MSNFKKLVEARMLETGESWAAAVAKVKALRKEAVFRNEVILVAAQTPKSDEPSF